MVRPTRAVGCLLALALWVGACPRPTGPERAVSDWVGALEREDPAAAERLLARPARSGTDRAALARRIRAVDGASLRETARLAGDARVTAVEARWPFGGDTLVVARSEDRWVLRHGVLGLYPCDTPATALGSFLAAWRRERWDVVHRLGPREARAQLTPDGVAARLRDPALKEALDLRAAEVGALLASDGPLPLEPDPSGAAVTLPYGPYRARLLLEDGCWRVADL